VFSASAIPGVSSVHESSPSPSIDRAHQLVDLLHAPAAVHEFDRQPVQQILMRGRLAHLPEVLEGRDDAAPEVFLESDKRNHAPRAFLVAPE